MENRGAGAGIFLTGHCREPDLDDQLAGRRQIVACGLPDKITGKLLHDVEVLGTEDAGPKHRLNGYASPTPVLDGEHVFVHFGPRGTA